MNLPLPSLLVIAERSQARAALDAVEAGELDPDIFRPGALDVLAQHIMACACAAPFKQGAMLAEVRSALAYSALSDETFDQVLGFIRDGGYALKAYEKFKRLTQDADGLWRVSHPKFVAQHRLNAGIIVEAARIAADAMPLLRDLGRNATRLHALTERIVKLEGHADEIHDAGLKALFKTKADKSPIAFVIGREIYSHLEKITDRFEDVANEIQGLVLDHA